MTAIVRVTLRNGSYHEDVGYGTIDNVKQKGAALDKVSSLEAPLVFTTIFMPFC